ncbi:alpha/beta fold hydrolase [Umezawaea sp. NPDC059074]|uniref:alpha/beta fold hydrolase n=1 Tax=Umezawaea sp. NPDC059074 TaxID=3346716 RepID=UPI00367E83C1
MRTGTLPGGLPYMAIGRGRPLVFLPGFGPEHTVPTGWGRRIALSQVRALAEHREVFWVNRKPGLAPGTTMSDLAAQHAVALRERFGAPVDLMGHSTGASIVLQVLVEHPSVVRRGVVVSGAYALGPLARPQLRMGELLAEGKPGYHLIAPGMTRNPVLLPLLTGVMWAAGLFVRKPANPSDMLAVLRAEDVFDVRERLADIPAPTLVVCGERDYFWTPEMFAETAARIPHGRLISYPRVGHNPMGDPRFTPDVLAFLDS